MLNVNDIRNNLEAIASTLNKCDKNTATLLRDLSFTLGEAVRGKSQIESWSVSNIQQVINPALAIERFRNQRITDKSIATLEWVRNSLIFAPLVLTWLGISTAVSQYKAEIDADPNQITQPFIYLWEQGFGNRLPWFFTLGGVASVDFILLLSVLLMTIAVYSLVNGIKLRREEQANELSSTLYYTLSCITLWLTARGSNQPTGFVDRLTQATQKFDQTITALMDQLTAMADRQKDDWKTFDALKTQLANVVTTVTSSLAGIKTANESLSQSVNGLVTPAQNIASNQQTLIQITRKAGDDFQAQTAAHKQAIQEIQNLRITFQNAVTKLETTIQAHEQVTQSISGFTNKQENLIVAMENERKLQAEISNQVLLESNNMKRVVADISTCARELNGVNVQMDIMIRNLVGSMTRMGIR